MRAITTAVEADHVWRPDLGLWLVSMWSGLRGVLFPGWSGAEVNGGGSFAEARAVVDDFGDLVVVGMWS